MSQIQVKNTCKDKGVYKVWELFSHAMHKSFNTVQHLREIYSTSYGNGHCHVWAQTELITDHTKAHLNVQFVVGITIQSKSNYYVHEIT